MDGFLKSIRIQNYRCVKDATLDLGPLTVLAGPNASGKSTILSAMDIHQGLTSQDRRFKDLTLEVRVDWQIGFGTGVQQGSRCMDALSAATTTHGLLYKPQSHRFDAEKIRLPVAPDDLHSVTTSGAGLANSLCALPREQQIEVSKRFCKLTHVYSDVEIKTHESNAGRGENTLLFRDRWNKDLLFTPNEVSDGSLLLLALLMIPFQRDPVDLILIDEPQTNLHPYLLENLVWMFRSLATGKLGPRPIQVVLATHSPALLNYLEPSEVRFIRREKSDGSTTVRTAPLDNPDWAEIYDHFDRELGSIWLTGGLGGVPGRLR